MESDTDPVVMLRVTDCPSGREKVRPSIDLHNNGCACGKGIFQLKVAALAA